MIRLGTAQARRPPERRIPFENPRLETIPTDNPSVGQIPVFVGRDRLDPFLHRLRESGRGAGLILGFHSISNGVEWVEIDGFTVPDPAISDGLPPAAAGWESMLKEREERFPDALGLGWWNARTGDLLPNDTEESFHRRFFSLPWCLGMLVEPTSGTPRFFQWTQGRIEECGYFIVQPRRA